MSSLQIGDAVSKTMKHQNNSPLEIDVTRRTLNDLQLWVGFLKQVKDSWKTISKTMRLEETDWRSVVTPTVGTVATLQYGAGNAHEFSVNVTIPALGNDRCVLVAMSWPLGWDTALASCKFNGVNMTFVKVSSKAGSGECVVYKIMEDQLPVAAGTYAVTIDTYYLTYSICVGVVPLTGVAQAVPHGTVVENETESITVTGYIGSLAIDFDAFVENATNTPDTSQTLQFSLHSSGGLYTEGLSCSTETAVATTTVMNWTDSRTTTGHIGMALHGHPVLVSFQDVTKIIFPLNTLTNLGNGVAEVDFDDWYPALVDPSTNNNFVSFNGVHGQQKDSGYDATDFQPIDATLTSIALLGTAANKMLYTTGVDTWAEADLTAAGRALNDDADAAAQRVTLGLLAVTVKTSGYTLTTSDRVIVCNSTTAFTITLPAASGSGQTYTVKNINTGTITISKSGDTIDGVASQTLGQWDSIDLVDYAANAWVIV